jgi:hypothetical protein
MVRRRALPEMPELVALQRIQGELERDDRCAFKQKQKQKQKQRQKPA